MSKVLRVSPDATLPVAVLTDSTTIFGRKRSGKSNNAVVLVEEALDLHAQVVILDPKGDWWGITSSFDGKSEGYHVVVIGGAHGTPGIKLNPLAGAAVAEWVLTTGHSVIIDLSLTKTADVERFCAPFLETIRRYKTEKPGPILIVADEADELAPQEERERAHVMDTYRALVWMVKRGGAFGVGSVVATQRPASLSKNITTQSETIITLHTLGSQDLDAESDALKHHVEGDTKQERAAALENLMREIVRLDKGQTVIVSGAAGLKGKIHRIQFRRRRTFDSGATPEFGKTVAAPKVVAKPDLARLSAEMEKVVEDARANDPATLKQRIRELEAAGRKASADSAPSIQVAKQEVVKVPALKPGERASLAKVPDEVDRAAANLYRVLEAAKDISRDLRSALSAESTYPPSGKVRPAGNERGPSPAVDSAVRTGRAAEAASERAATTERDRPTFSAPSPRRSIQGERPGRTDDVLAPRQQRIIDTVAELGQLGIEPTRDSVAAWLGIHPNGKGFGNDLGALRAAEMLDGLRLTAKGTVWARPDATPGSDEAVHDRVMRALAPRQRRILEHLIAAYPHGLTRDQLADLMQVHPNGKGYGNDLGALRTRGVVEKGSPIRAAAILFPYRSGRAA